MGCSQSSVLYESKSKYENDKSWEELATWGKDLGINTWSKDIVSMNTIHPKLFMGSRLSAQEVIDKGKLTDQDGKIYTASKFHVVCVASEKTCQYCEISDKFKGYDIQDRNQQSDDFLNTGIKTAKHIHKKLRHGNYVLVHCHSGRNRSALAILLYAGMYTNLTYEDALHKIKLHNSSRFSMQSTLQNNQFTQSVKQNWSNLKGKSGRIL